MSVLENTVNQAIADFDSIESAIKDMGVEVPQGTDTSEYAQKIRNVAKAKYDSGYNDGVEAGKQAEYDTFWDAYQQNGKRNDYSDSFYNVGWNDTTYNPKYPMVINNGKNAANGMFAWSKITNTKVHITIYQATGALGASSQIVTIPYIEFKQMTSITNSFVGMTKLKNITFGGTIEVSISFPVSPLTVESMKNVITHLKDYSGTDKSGTNKVTFTSACLAALDAEGATSPNNNTWRQYINDLGWIC